MSQKTVIRCKTIESVGDIPVDRERIIQTKDASTRDSIGVTPKLRVWYEV